MPTSTQDSDASAVNTVPNMAEAQPAPFDLKAMVPQAEARLAAIAAEKLEATAAKATAQARLNALRDEEASVKRFISASTPRKSSKAKPAAKPAKT
jgi:hypothetical protein